MQRRPPARLVAGELVLAFTNTEARRARRGAAKPVRDTADDDAEVWRVEIVAKEPEE